MFVKELSVVEVGLFRVIQIQFNDIVIVKNFQLVGFHPVTDGGVLLLVLDPEYFGIQIVILLDFERVEFSGESLLKFFEREPFNYLKNLCMQYVELNRCLVLQLRRYLL